MNKSKLLDYYNKYTNNSYSNDKAIMFDDMLNNKAYFCYQNNKKVYAYDNLYSYDDFVNMISLFNKLITDQPELRGY